jgi:hypothetical protein
MASREAAPSHPALVAGLLVALVVAAGTAAALSAGWDVVVRYEYDRSRDEISYSQVGGGVPALQCDGEWETLRATSTSAATLEHWIEYRMDHADGRIEVRHANQGTIGIREYGCSGNHTAGPTVPGTGWQDHRTTRSSCGSPDASIQDTNPPHDFPDETFPASFATDQRCLEARGAATHPDEGEVPLTGQVVATVETPDGQLVGQAETCHMVVGSCWDQASPGWVSMFHDGDAVDQEWTLKCEVEGPFELGHEGWGSYGCEAWFH